MVTEATKKYREIFAAGLLGVAALYFVSGLSLLFKSSDDLGGAGFSDKAALFGYLFTHPLLVISLFGAVALVTGFGENSKNAKPVVVAALGLGAVSLLFAVICWVSAFGTDTEGNVFGVTFNGVLGAGKVVGVFLGLAQLVLLGLVTFYAFTAFQTFPKAVPVQQNQWGQQAGWGHQGGYDQGQQAGWGQPGSYDQGQQAGWGQPGGYDQGQQAAWGQPGAYDQGQHGGYDPAQQQQAWAGWGEQAQAQGEQGQPASSWEQMSSPQPAPQAWGQPDPVQQGWGQPDPAQQGWAQPAEPEQPSPPAAPAGETIPPTADETQVWDAAQEGQRPAEPSEEERRDDEQPPQQGWWQQPNQ